MTLPQPSPLGPQLKPCCVQVCGTHVAPQTPGETEPHTWPPGQLPQSTTPPQPSACLPQVKPCCAHVRGVHCWMYGVTHEERSKMRYSNTFSCAVIGPTVHWFGHGPRPVASMTWKS